MTTCVNIVVHLPPKPPRLDLSNIINKNKIFITVAGSPNLSRADDKYLKRSSTSQDLIPQIVTTPPTSPTKIAAGNDIARRPKVATVSRIVREFEKFATLRSRNFNPDSFAEETDSSQMTVTSDVTISNPNQKRDSQGQNIFVKNRRKNNGANHKRTNLDFLTQISTGVSPTYRRHRRQGIHVVKIDSTDV